MEPEGRDNDDLGDIYGDPTEDMDFQPVQNPYYGGDIEMEVPQARGKNKRTDLNDTEIVTTTQNMYYEM